MIAMRHVRLLCVLLIAKPMVCDALLPALTCSSQFAAHVHSSHMDSSGAERRATLVLAAASEASAPVRSATLCVVLAHCGIASAIENKSFAYLCSCIVCVAC
jgi:hypothetical protein